MVTKKLKKPPLILFLIHIGFFITSIFFFLNILNINSYLYLSLIVHAAGFVCLLIFLTIDKSISISRNYSPDFTVTTSKSLLYVYILFATYLSWEIGYDLAYEEFLTGF